MPDQFFVSLRDAGRTALLLGPFSNEADCRRYAYSDPEEGGSDKHNEMRDAIYEIDRSAHFMCWGMVKIAVKPGEVFKTVLNRVDPAKWDKVLS